MCDRRAMNKARSTSSQSDDDEWEASVVARVGESVDAQGRLDDLGDTLSDATASVDDCLPVRLKGVYIINNPAVFDLLFGIAKTFLKAKLMKRIRLLGYDVEELRQLIPNDVIPEEHGGTNESYDFDALEKELESEEEFLQTLGTYGYRDALAETDPECNGLLTDETTLSEEYVHL
ncbi:hypothetical protein HPB50_005574 [Hyalomma asiaticum]|uniref:Uncharacterized protein n=1 Tax=Hyalomma asiaticum TaxID=266040 RepID=A0ACB7SNB7_HYAAI|nr:hypothetical protein HPB50_005574 [Hyalomma asiaticum]